MLEEGPSRLFDALASILGLEDLIDAADALKETRASRTKAHKAVQDRLDSIREKLKTHPDERAAKCLEALAGRQWQLETVTELLSADRTSAEADSEIRRLRELAGLRGPEPAAVGGGSASLEVCARRAGGRCSYGRGKGAPPSGDPRESPGFSSS